MIQRLGAALVGLAILLPSVVYGGVLAVDLVVSVAGAICVAEYAAMAFPNDRYGKGLGMAAAVGLVHLGVVLGGVSGWSAALALATVGAMIFVTLRPGETLDRAADDVGRVLIGATWIPLLSTLCLLRREEDGLAWCFLVLAVSWLGDTGGYFAGKYLGSHPMYPKVSPKKTWEGVFGGVILSTVGTWVTSRVGLPGVSLAEVLVLGPVLCVVGILGDLAESLLKRSFGVKDAGWIMPGHGGMLDRIDSVLFVAPCVWLVARWGHG